MERLLDIETFSEQMVCLGFNLSDLRWEWVLTWSIHTGPKIHTYIDNYITLDCSSVIASPFITLPVLMLFSFLICRWRSILFKTRSKALGFSFRYLLPGLNMADSPAGNPDWRRVNMAPINPHCYRSPWKARTPSPRTFFSNNYPDSGRFHRLFNSLRHGEDPWAPKPVALPANDNEVGGRYHVADTPPKHPAEIAADIDILSLGSSPKSSNGLQGTPNVSSTGIVTSDGNGEDEGYVSTQRAFLEEVDDDPKKFQTPDRKTRYPMTSPNRIGSSVMSPTGETPTGNPMSMAPIKSKNSPSAHHITSVSCKNFQTPTKSASASSSYRKAVSKKNNDRDAAHPFFKGPSDRKK